jgi:hypothetical protein
MIGLARFEGMAKPIPTLPPFGLAMAVLMPITCPLRLKVGPPELPWLIEASTWRKSSNGPAWMSRLRAETMPAVTDPPRPKGLPTAMIQSPTLSASESPHSTAGSSRLASILSNARSVCLSTPTTLASYCAPSVRVTLMPAASSMTWLFVTT